MPELIIDGMHIQVRQGMTLIQACDLASREIPRFCYHERLAIAGNCRMCLVEVEKMPKLVASCAMEAQESMIVHTNSDRVRKAREAVMEFLLINHPLDCPICDQGGECDLQDQAMAYGRGVSRFLEEKRAVEDKCMGPLIKTAMTRCIHCTRCVRFAEDVAGVPAIGTINRGEDMEITTLEKAINSELSGNVIDLCPVGALTSKPYAFKARPWEMKKIPCVDTMDGVGSSISAEVFGNEIMRILPRFNKEVNEEWISDKIRFSYDGLMNQRLDTPYLRKNGTLTSVSWNEALNAAANKMRVTPKEKIGAIVGGINSCEDMFMLSEFMGDYMVHNVDCRPPGSILDAGNRSSYVLNVKISNIENADLIILIGTNPRWEAPIINAKIRQTWLKNQCSVFCVGEQLVDLTYPVVSLGECAGDVKKLLSEPILSKIQSSSNPLMLIGSHLATRKDSYALFCVLEEILDKGNFIKKNWRGYGMIQTQAGQVGGLHVNCVPKGNGMCTEEMLRGGNLDLLYLLGADEFDLSNLEKTFIVYQGSHGDVSASRADLILPGAACTEKMGTWVNTEGRVQNSMAAVTPPGQAKDDWKIFRALSEFLGCALPYNIFEEVRMGMYEKYSHLRIWNSIIPSKWNGLKGKPGKLLDTQILMEVRDFYLTNPIVRSSSTMAECSAIFSRDLSRNN